MPVVAGFLRSDGLRESALVPYTDDALVGSVSVMEAGKADHAWNVGEIAGLAN
jgi:hypothetical protein